MIELLIGIPTIILASGLFWATGQGVAFLTKEDLSLSEKISMGFMAFAVIGLGTLFCWGVGAVVMHFLK